MRSQTNPNPFAILPLLLAIVLGGMYIASPDSQYTLLTLSFVALLATVGGEARVLLYCYGLSIAFTATLVNGVPGSAIILVAIVIGALGRALITKKVGAPDRLLLIVAYLAGAYALLLPASSPAGRVASYSLFILPASLLILRWTLAGLPSQSGAVMWFTVGSAIPIGIGLVQAYHAVGTNYASYQDSRIFVSVIGSSNHAAAIALIPGFLLLVQGLKPAASLKKAVLILVALPFLSAPFVLASRGSVVALAFGLLVIAFSADRGRGLGVHKGRVFVVLSAVIALGLTAMNQNWYVWQRFIFSDASGQYLSGRSTLWSTTIDYIQHYPFSGVGPGHLSDQLMALYGIAYGHEFYLETLAQLGIFGGLVYLWAIRPKPLGTWSPLMPAIVVIMVNSAVEPVMSDPMGATLFAGLAAVHWLHTRQNYQIATHSHLEKLL